MACKPLTINIVQIETAEVGFHDGAPVRGADCVASVKRWMARDGHGQALATVLDESKPTATMDLRSNLKSRSASSSTAWARYRASRCS
jgi:peptide/nickel transport system substrate-binding protein